MAPIMANSPTYATKVHRGGRRHPQPRSHRGSEVRRKRSAGSLRGGSCAGAFRQWSGVRLRRTRGAGAKALFLARGPGLAGESTAAGVACRATDSGQNVRRQAGLVPGGRGGQEKTRTGSRGGQEATRAYGPCGGRTFPRRYRGARVAQRAPIGRTAEAGRAGCVPARPKIGPRMGAQIPAAARGRTRAAQPCGK